MNNAIQDALEIFKKCTIREDHRCETDTQKEHYDFILRMSGKEYRSFIAALKSSPVVCSKCNGKYRCVCRIERPVTKEEAQKTLDAVNSAMRKTINPRGGSKAIDDYCDRKFCCFAALSTNIETIRKCLQAVCDD